MKITYFAGLHNITPYSMAVYKRNLIQNVRDVRPDIITGEYSPHMFDFNIPHLHVDRTINRFLTYPLMSRWHVGKINHVLDHTYASVFNFTPQRVAKIVTVHDLFLLRSKMSFFKLFSVPGLHKADMIIAISKATKNDLIIKLDIPANKIVVIHLGVDHNIFKPLRFQLPHDRLKGAIIILTVGNHELRKNTILILKAIQRIITKYPKLIFVKVGSEDPAITNYIYKSGLGSHVLYLHNVSEIDLVHLYNAASLFVYPSLYEGFGLPPLEAMACGCPVITSNTSSFPEVVGDAGIMVDPYSADELATAMDRVLTDDNLRKKMTYRGLQRAKQFSWEKTAKETINIYDKFIRT